MIFITEESEIQYNKITCLYFYSSWMPFHKKMMVMISKIEEKYNNVQFYAIDTDHFKNFCQRLEVKEIPTVIVKNNDKELTRIIGLVLTSAFKSIFVDICSK